VKSGIVEEKSGEKSSVKGKVSLQKQMSVGHRSFYLIFIEAVGKLIKGLDCVGDACILAKSKRRD